MTEKATVLVLGAYGLIGRDCVRHLQTKGYRVIGLGRNRKTAQRLLPDLEWRWGDIGKLRTAADWHPYLKNIDLVVNAAGALQTGQKDNVSDVQDRAIRALIEACEIEQVPDFIQISAVGVSEAASTEFMSSKAKADRALRESELNWTILRPGLVIGASAYGGTAALRMLASVPIVQPVTYGTAQIQTIGLADLSEIVGAVAAGAVPSRQIYDVVEDSPHSLKDVIAEIRAWQGFPAARLVISLPAWVSGVVASLSDGLSHLGWRPPLRRTSFKVIAEDILGDPEPLRRARGRSVTSLAETLRTLPSSLQERWFARLYLCFPVILLTLSLFWLTSGIIGALEWRTAAQIIPKSKLAPDFAVAFVFIGAIIDVALAIGILVRRSARLAALGMVAVTIFYLFMGTILTPALWLDPLGPFVKTIPAALLALVALAMLEER